MLRDEHVRRLWRELLDDVGVPRRLDQEVAGADAERVPVAVDVAGLSDAETAYAFGIAEGTVMSRLYRARQQASRMLAAWE